MIVLTWIEALKKLGMRLSDGKKNCKQIYSVPKETLILAAESKVVKPKEAEPISNDNVQVETVIPEVLSNHIKPVQDTANATLFYAGMLAILSNKHKT